MSDPLDQLLAESKHSEDGARDAGRKVFEQALERVKAVAKCIPDDKEDLADEKSDWTIKWEGSLKRLWDALAAARKLGAEATIDKSVLLEFKHLKATSTRWKEEAQCRKTAMDVQEASFATAPEVPQIVDLMGSAPASTPSSHVEVAMMTHPDRESQGDASTEGARNDVQEATLHGKPGDPEAIQHDTPCDRCAAAALPCWGVLGRVCERCKPVQQRCTKSSGRGGLRVKRKRDADADGELPPEASKPQRLRTVQKTRVSSPPKDAHNDNDAVEVIDTPPAISKGKQKAQPSKPSKSSKPSVIIMPKNPTTLPKPSKPSILVTPLSEKPNQATGVPTEFLKTLGQLESLALVASAEVKRAQAETKRAEGTLDIVLSEIRSFRNKYEL